MASRTLLTHVLCVICTYFQVVDGVWDRYRCLFDEAKHPVLYGVRSSPSRCTYIHTYIPATATWHRKTEDITHVAMGSRFSPSLVLSPM